MKKRVYGVSTLAAGSLLLCGSLWVFGQHVGQDGQKQKPAPSDQPFVTREQTELVSLTVSVTDRDGRAYAGLTVNDLEVYEDKVKQKIEHYSTNDAPISAGVVFDLSGSMQPKLEAARAALKAFVDTSHADDDIFLVGFNQQAHLLAEFSDAESMRRQVNVVHAKGDTALYDAAYLGIEKVLHGRHRRRLLLIISDGQDNASRYSVGQLRQRLKETDVQVYCIGINRPGLHDKAELREQQRGQMILEELARLTGGRTFFVNTNAALEEAASRVALEVRQQYSLGYTPTNQQRDGRWRKIQVRVNRTPDMPPLTVRTREGYFAAGL